MRKIDPRSAAAEIGLREGDVIVEVNHAQTPDLDAFRAAARTTDAGVLLLVDRDGAVYMPLSR